MTATEAEVEAVGEAIEDAAMRHLGRDLGTIHRDAIASAAIAAVEPLIRERLAQEVETEVISHPTDDEDECFNTGVQNAARLVRGDAS